MQNETDRSLLSMTANIVSAHAANNPMQAAELTNLIERVYRALADVAAGPSAEPERPQPPPVAVKKSITPDFLICLEDGKKLKMLKRHMKTTYNLTPAEYRERWGLPSDYPMVAPNYARQRSRLAKEIGLGTRSRTS